MRSAAARRQASLRAANGIRQQVQKQRISTDLAGAAAVAAADTGTSQASIDSEEGVLQLKVVNGNEPISHWPATGERVQQTQS
jgi:hypothetical protein